MTAASWHWRRPPAAAVLAAPRSAVNGQGGRPRLLANTDWPAKVCKPFNSIAGNYELIMCDSSRYQHL